MGEVVLPYWPFSGNQRLPALDTDAAARQAMLNFRDMAHLPIS